MEVPREERLSIRIAPRTTRFAIAEFAQQSPEGLSMAVDVADDVVMHGSFPLKCMLAGKCRRQRVPIRSFT